MHYWYIQLTPIYLNQGFLSLCSIVFAMHTCMHCWYIHFILNTLIQGFHHQICCICKACMHALLIRSIHTNLLESRFLSLYSVVFAMHTCKHCWYIHFTPNTLIQGFHHHSLLHLQSMHACIADTFNSHHITRNRVFVIIFRCVCNAYMCALLIHSLYTKYPDSGFLSW